MNVLNMRMFTENVSGSPLCIFCNQIRVIFEPPRGKTNNVVSEQVRQKPDCTSTEESLKLEISDLSRRGIVLSE